MNMAAPQGNTNVIKSLTPETLEKGYRTYAALRDEEAVKGLVEKEWQGRYQEETARALVHCEENEITKEMMNDDTRIYPNN